MDAKVICVLGMHRSGTSLLMKLLNILGVYIGKDEDLLSEAEDNEKGFWEHKKVLEINIELLKRFGGSWDNPPNFPPKWEKSRKIKDLDKKARNFIKGMNANASIWGFKDPRTCLTLPFWKKHITNMSYIVAVRNMTDVAHSLQKREGMSLERGKQLSFIYWLHIIKNIQNMSYYFIRFSDIFNNRKALLLGVIDFIDTDELQFEPNQKAIESFISPKLVHHRNKDQDQLEEKVDLINSDHRAIYKAFFDDMYNNLKTVFGDRSEEINRLQTTLETQGEFAVRKEREVDELNLVVKELQKENKRLNNELEKKHTKSAKQ